MRVCVCVCLGIYISIVIIYDENCKLKLLLYLHMKNNFRYSFIHIHEYIVERIGRVVKEADCRFTGRGFESTLAPLITCVRALNKFSLKSTSSVSPSRINRYRLSWSNTERSMASIQASSLTVTVVK